MTKVAREVWPGGAQETHPKSGKNGGREGIRNRGERERKGKEKAGSAGKKKKGVNRVQNFIF